MFSRLSVTTSGTARVRAQLALTTLCTLAVIAGVSGLTAETMFRQAGTLKWLVAFGGPLALLMVLNAREPLRPLVGAVIVAAPFGFLQAKVAGFQLPLLAALLVAAIAAATLAGPRPRPLSPLGKAGIAGAALFAIPLFSGSGISAQVILLGTAALVAWLVSSVSREPAGMRFVFGSLVLSGVIQAVLAIWELQTKHQLNFYGSAGSAVFGSGYFFGYGSTFRPVGSFYDPISLGNALSIAMPLALVLAARQDGVRKRLLGTAAIGVIGVGLLITLSRMSWVGAAAGLVLATVLLPWRDRGRAVMVLLPLAVVLALVIAGMSGNAFGSRFNSIFHPRASTVATAPGDVQRVEIWDASLKVWASHPIAGVGLNNMVPALSQRLPYIGLYAQAQSTYLQVLGEGGLLGGAALVLLLLTQGRVLVSALSSSQRALAAGLAGATLAMMVGWISDVTVRYTPVAACMAVLFGAAAGLWQGGCAPRDEEEDHASASAPSPAPVSAR